MSPPAKPTAVETFLDALRTPSKPTHTSLVNSAALGRDARTGLAAAERLRGYGDFLELARAAKAKSPRTGTNIDREVCAQSRRALEDVNALAVSAMRIVRNTNQSGALAVRMGSCKAALQRSGVVSVVDMWKHATGSVESRDLLRGVGLTDDMYDAFDATIRAVDLQVSADTSQIVVVGSVNGAAVKGGMITAPRPPPSRVTELLAGGRFDALAEAIEMGEAPYLAGLALPDHEPRPEEVMMAVVLASQRDMVRHVRKLEDVGLSTYRGASAAAVLLIAVVVVTVATGLGIYYCDIHVNNTLCTIFTVICFLGYLLGLAAVGADIYSNTSNPTTLTGSPVVHGVVRDFVLRP